MRRPSTTQRVVTRMAERRAKLERNTNETQICLELNIDGTGKSEICTGVGFFDHMLTHIAKHGMMDLKLRCTGDLHVDAHHTVEDVGIVLGQAIKEAVGDKRGIVRYGSALCPMDETLVGAALDLCNRTHLNFDVRMQAAKVGDFDAELALEFFRAVADNSMMTLHIWQQYGQNTHHILEAAFKAFGKALDAATMYDPRRAGELPSTKGML